MQAKLTKAQKFEVYKKLLNIEDPDKIDRRKNALQLGNASL